MIFIVILERECMLLIFFPIPIKKLNKTELFPLIKSFNKKNIFGQKKLKVKFFVGLDLFPLFYSFNKKKNHYIKKYLAWEIKNSFSIGA